MILNPLTAQVEINSIWRYAVFLGTVGCFIYWIKDQILTLEGAFLAYFAVQALYILDGPWLPFGDFNTAFQTTAGQALAEVLIMLLFITRLPTHRAEWLLKKLKWVMCFEIILLWCKVPALMNAPSFDTALLALYLPFAPWWLALASLVTIVTHHGATALMIIMAQFLIKDWRRIEWKYAFFIPPILAAAYFFQIDPYLQRVPMFNPGARLGMYARYMKFWSQSWWFIVFGVGPGSFMWTGMMIDKFTPPMFLQMHSDWLQITYELGIVGLGFAIGVFWKTLKRVQGDPQLLSAVVGAGVFCCTYHPLRFFPSAILIALIFSYKKR